MSVIEFRERKETDSSLIDAIKADIKQEGIKLSDSDMFAYCDFYTGDFWLTDIRKAA